MSQLAIIGLSLLENLMEMARIGATANGGCNRLGLTDLKGRNQSETRQLIIIACKQ